MKRLNLLLALLFAIVLSGLSQTEIKSANKNDSNTIIEAYYFHYSHRCATCLAVEDVTVNSLKELYPSMMKDEDITFLSVDMDTEEGEEFAKIMKVSGQTLIITTKDSRVDLTNEAFMYARSNPVKLREKIKATVDKMLE